MLREQPQDPPHTLIPPTSTPTLHSLQTTLNRLQSQLALLTARPTLTPFRRLFHLAPLDAPHAAREIIRHIRHSPSSTLFQIARLCVSGPVGPVAQRRALRAVALLLCDELLARHPDHVDAMCLKGETLLPYIHYGKNDSRAPRSVLQEAYDLFDRATKKGSTLGLFLKGRWLLSMQPLHKDATRAEMGCSCVKSAAEANCARALVFLAHRYEYPELDHTVSFAADLPKGKVQRERFILDFYQRAANLGDADALNDIGTSYAEGYGGLECDFDKAVEYYVRAIDKGSLHAFDNLGTHYETGMGNRFPDRVDYEKALYYYRQGARQRCPKCAYNLAAAHEEGMSGALPRNSRRAEKYYRHAIKLADDANDIITASKCLKDLVALYITRIKLNAPEDRVVRKATKRLSGLVGDQGVVDRAMAKVNKAIASASRSKGAAISKLVGDVNSKLIVQQVKQLEQKVKSGQASRQQVVKWHHILGTQLPELPLEQVIEQGETGRKRTRGKTSAGRAPSTRKKRRKRW